MDQDVFRYLLRGRGRPATNYSGVVLLEKADFDRFNLPHYWHYFLNELGEGGEPLPFPLEQNPILANPQKGGLKEGVSYVKHQLHQLKLLPGLCHDGHAMLKM